MKYHPFRLRYQIGSDSKGVLALINKPLNSGENKKKDLVDNCSKECLKPVRKTSKSKENTRNCKFKKKYVVLDDCAVTIFLMIYV